MVEQGTIIKIEKITYPALVVSKNIYNKSGHVILCPILKCRDEIPTLGEYVECEDISGYVCCDNPRQIDINTRGYNSVGYVPLSKLIVIIDKLQSMFDYY